VDGERDAMRKFKSRRQSDFESSSSSNSRPGRCIHVEKYGTKRSPINVRLRLNQKCMDDVFGPVAFVNPLRGSNMSPALFACLLRDGVGVRVQTTGTVLDHIVVLGQCLDSSGEYTFRAFERLQPRNTAVIQS